MKVLYNVDPLILERDFTDLIDPPIIIRVMEIDDDAAEDFSQDISKAHRTGQPVIPVLIDSPGGSVYSCLSMMSDIKHSKLPVATIAVGGAMSCGAVLLSCGTPGYRYCDPYATVMIHDISSYHEGKNEEIKTGSQQTDTLNRMMYQTMAKNCGHKDEDHFLKIIHEKGHAEWYLTPKDAKKHKIVNEIGMPDIYVDVSVNISLK